MDAGKHVYQEKAMAFTVDHAKAMRAARERAPDSVVQVGHQACSSGQVARCRHVSVERRRRPRDRDPCTHVPQYAGRQTAVDASRLSRYDARECRLGELSWATRRHRDFDPDRLVNWRLFWDYSGGNVHENMSHQFAFWSKVMELNIPWPQP